MILRLALATVLLLTPMAAQRRTPGSRSPTPGPRPAAPSRWPLAAIQVTGNKVFPAESIVKATGLKLGDLVNPKDLERAVDRLTATGAFETISFRYDPVGEKLAVTFQVQEVMDVYPIAFERLEVPEAELMKALGEKVPLFGPQVPATGAMVKHIVEAIESYKNIRVLGRVTSVPGGKLVMMFRPVDSGPSITFVQFEGSNILRAVDLQKVFYQVAVGLPYNEARLNELLDNNIRPLFEEKGRLQVRFGPFRVEDSKEPAGVLVTVPVQDRDEYHFGTVKFAGNALFPQKDLSRLAKLETDELANFALVNKAVADIERLYKRNGFMHVKATADRKLDDEKKSVDLTIRIEEGERYKFRDLTIKGIDINAEAAVRRRWAIKRDEPFDDAYPEVFIQHIEQEQMFEQLAKIRPRVTVDEEKKTVDVELIFEGAPAQRNRPRRPQ